jgi:hypothetical protein
MLNNYQFTLGWDLLDKLSQVDEFSDELLNILISIKQEISNPLWNTYSNSLAYFLVNLTC